MAKMAYCWRCKAEVPMLDEREWAEVYPDLNEGIRLIKQYMRSQGRRLPEAKGDVYGGRAPLSGVGAVGK